MQKQRIWEVSGFIFLRYSRSWFMEYIENWVRLSDEYRWCKFMNCFPVHGTVLDPPYYRYSPSYSLALKIHISELGWAVYLKLCKISGNILWKTFEASELLIYKLGINSTKCLDTGSHLKKSETCISYVERYWFSCYPTFLSKEYRKVPHDVIQ